MHRFVTLLVNNENNADFNVKTVERQCLGCSLSIQITSFVYFSRKSRGQGSNRMSTRSSKWQRDGVVRSSLQAQSRDFELLCEFMMRVNPLYDSSEGWREESDSGEVEEYEHRPLETRSEQANAHRESRSIVMDLGRQTVEHWARFAKKASI